MIEKPSIDEKPIDKKATDQIQTKRGGSQLTENSTRLVKNYTQLVKTKSVLI